MVNLTLESVEKCRQRRSRPLAVLTYSLVRSALPSGCGLAGRAFLNTPLSFIRLDLGYPPADQQAKNYNNSTVPAMIDGNRLVGDGGRQFFAEGGLSPN